MSANMKTSDITTAELWNIVAAQWTRGEGRPVLEALKFRKEVALETDTDTEVESDTESETACSDNNEEILEVLQRPANPPGPIYVEKFGPIDKVLNFTAFAKNLPSEPGVTLPRHAHMLTVDITVYEGTAYFFRAPEDLSLLIAMACDYTNDVFGKELKRPRPAASLSSQTIDEASRQALLRGESLKGLHLTNLSTEPSSNQAIAMPLSLRPNIPDQLPNQRPDRLTLSHPAIRQSIKSLELGIYPPHPNDFNPVKGRYDLPGRMESTMEALKKHLVVLAEDLASFHHLEFIRIVMMGWGRGDGQDFRKGGIGADCVLPFCSLLDSGVQLGISIQMWNSIKVEGVGPRFVVKDFRREMNALETQDLEESCEAQRLEDGLHQVDLINRVEDKTSVFYFLLRRKYLEHGRVWRW